MVRGRSGRGISGPGEEREREGDGGVVPHATHVLLPG